MNASKSIVSFMFGSALATGILLTIFLHKLFGLLIIAVSIPLIILIAVWIVEHWDD